MPTKFLEAGIGKGSNKEMKHFPIKNLRFCAYKATHFKHISYFRALQPNDSNKVFSKTC